MLRLFPNAWYYRIFLVTHIRPLHVSELENGLEVYDYQMTVT